MISEVFLFENGNVLVFDENGEQIPEFQGQYQEVRSKILARAPKGAKFYHSTWFVPQGRLTKREVPRKEW